MFRRGMARSVPRTALSQRQPCCDDVGDDRGSAVAGRAWPAEFGKWPTLLWLSLATLLAMATWFSASAVVPALTAAWDLDEAGRAWLTMSVQAGFVVGALGSALLNV